MDINIEKKRIKDFSNFHQKINNKLKALGGSISELVTLNEDLLKKNSNNYFDSELSDNLSNFIPAMPIQLYDPLTMTSINDFNLSEKKKRYKVEDRNVINRENVLKEKIASLESKLKILENNYLKATQLKQRNDTSVLSPSKLSDRLTSQEIDSVNEVQRLKQSNQELKEEIELLKNEIQGLERELESLKERNLELENLRNEESIINLNDDPSIQEFKRKYQQVLQNNQELKDNFLNLNDNANQAVTKMAIENRKKEEQLKIVLELLDSMNTKK